MATALVSEQRTHLRAVTMLTADLSVANTSWPVTIRNLSIRGALVQTAASVDVGEAVVLSRDRHCAAGEVRWRSADSVGIMFHEPINVPDWLHSKDSSCTSRAGKRDLGSECPEADALPPDTIACRVREEIAYISRVIEGVAGLLAEDPILRVRHSSRIQDLCMSEQMLRELGVILELDCSADAVQANATGPMRHRLLRERIASLGPLP